MSAFFAGGPAILASLARAGSAKLQKYANRLVHEIEAESSLRPPALPREAGTMSSDPQDVPTREFTVRGTELDELAPTMQRTAELETRKAQQREWLVRDDLARTKELLEREHAYRLMAEERAADRDEWKAKAEANGRELAELRNALNSGNTKMNLPGAHHAVRVTELDDRPTPRPQRLPVRPLPPLPKR